MNNFKNLFLVVSLLVVFGFSFGLNAPSAKAMTAKVMTASDIQDSNKFDKKTVSADSTFFYEECWDKILTSSGLVGPTARAKLNKIYGRGITLMLASQLQQLRQNVSVIVKKRDGTETRQYELGEEIPIKYDPGDLSRVECIIVNISDHMEQVRRR